jgi:hypothetical protein
MSVILDFDDLADGNDPYETLQLLKTRDAGFKVTLFAIPTRCSNSLLARYEKIADWCQLGIHGWRHARHECLAWTSEETQDKLLKAKSIYSGFVPLFKAPNWEICDEVYAGCDTMDVAVADHIRNIEIMPAGIAHYIYNIRLRNDTFTRMHGHIQPWAGTGLTEGVENGNAVNPKYLLPIGTPYAFVAEAVTQDKGVAVGR